MLEQSMERLTAEVQQLREAIERQTIALQQAEQRKSPNPAATKAPAAFLTERAVSDLTGLSVSTFRRWRLLKTGPPYKKFGSAVRYPHAELMSWLDAQGS
jgi:predicted DNA-binding transcriptional regulator AlpA